MISQFSNHTYRPVLPVALFALLALVGFLDASATVERLATTYQPLYNPQTSQHSAPEIRPVRFLTELPSPEAEFSAISASNTLGNGVSSRDVNLASIHGIQIQVEPVRRGNSVHVIVNMPESSQSDTVSGPRYARLHESVVRCVERVGLRQGYTTISLTLKRGKSKSTIQLDLANRRSPSESVSIPVELSFASDFVQALQSADIDVQEVRRSIFNGSFKGINKAAWIKTDAGILDAVFFPTEKQAEQVRVTKINGETGDRYKYRIQKSPSSAPRSIDANRKLYFVAVGSVFAQTDSEELASHLKRLESKKEPALTDEN